MQVENLPLCQALPTVLLSLYPDRAPVGFTPRLFYAHGQGCFRPNHVWPPLPIRPLNLGRSALTCLVRWGTQALEHLVEIYISPNGDHLWEVASTAPSGGGMAESLGVAKHFLSELKKMGKGQGEGAAADKSRTGMKRR